MAINLLVVGRDGNGKTCTASSIMGQKLSPSSDDKSGKVYLKTAKSTVSYQDVTQDVTIMDVSGLEYPDMASSKTNYKETFETIENAITEIQEGFCAMIIVVKYGLRFTAQERDAILMIRSTFGETVIKKYSVVVMTFGDIFAAEMEEDGISSFEGWCESQIGDFKALLDECEGRCVLFNNKENDIQKVDDQRKKLFELVTKIKSNVDPYTIQEYKEAASSRTHILVTSSLPKIKEEITDKLTGIGMRLDDLSRNPLSPSEQKTQLQTLQAEIRDIKVYLQEEDKGTNILDPLLFEMSLVEKSAELKLQIANKHETDNDAKMTLDKDGLGPRLNLKIIYDILNMHLV
jgi:hypothetical protein